MIRQVSSLMTMAAALAVAAAPPPEPLGKFGLGFIAGNPSGISASLATSGTSSINLIAGYNMNRYDNRYPRNGDCCKVGGIMYTSLDYVWYNYNILRVPGINFPVYYGPGVNWVISHYHSFGVRGVMGLQYQFAHSPFDVFFELCPGYNFNPHPMWGLDGGVGSRFYF